MAVQMTSEQRAREPIEYGRYRLGAWVVIASVTMLFTALSSAYIVRAASAPDWQPLTMPRILWSSTALLFVSSLTFEVAKRNLKSSSEAIFSRWISITFLLGCSFLTLQLRAWRQLAAQGIFLKTNPHSSFFYLLTAMHGLHLLVGLLALIFLLIRNGRKDRSDEVKQIAIADGVSVYWHFMDLLWIYLFTLLFVWRSV